MKHLIRYNEDLENPITDIMESELFSDFFYTCLDVIGIESAEKNIGFMWISKSIGINNWRYDKADFYNSIYSKSAESFSRSVGILGVLGDGTEYSNNGIRMCFCANFKIPVNTTLSLFLERTNRMKGLESLLERMDYYEKIEIRQHYENSSILRLYATISAEETIKIGNKVKMRLPSLRV